MPKVLGDNAPPKDIDEYISACPREVRLVLEQIRATIQAAVPEAQEAISYRMPTFLFHGVVLHFAAFKRHIGLYPPVRGDAALMEEIAPYVGEKGNLKLPLDQPIPLTMIGKIAATRARQNLAKAARSSPPSFGA